MLHKGVLTVAALAVLGSALAIAHSKPESSLRFSVAYVTKLDFDRVFANFEATSELPTATTTERELLRLAGTKRLIPAPPVHRLELVKTKIVDSGPTSNLFNVEGTLQTSNLDQTTMLRTLLTPETAAVGAQVSNNQAENAALHFLN